MSMTLFFKNYSKPFDRFEFRGFSGLMSWYFGEYISDSVHSLTHTTYDVNIFELCRTGCLSRQVALKECSWIVKNKKGFEEGHARRQTLARRDAMKRRSKSKCWQNLKPGLPCVTSTMHHEKEGKCE